MQKLVNTYILTLLVTIILATGNVNSQVWSLGQCVDSALVNNTKIKVAENSILLSELKNKEVKANLIPKVFVNGEYKYFIDLPYQLMPLSIFGGPEGQFKEAQFGVPHNIGANVNVQAPLYSSQLYGAIKKTEISKQLVELNVEKTKEDIYYDVNMLYRNGQLLMNQIVFLDSNIRNVEEIINSIQYLQMELLATGTDVKKAELQLANLKSKRANIQMNLDQILVALKIYVGTDLDAELSLEPVISVIALQSYDSNESREVGMLNLQNEILKQEIKTLNRSRYIPDLGIVGSYGVSGFGYDVEPNRFLNFYPISFVGVRMTYPLFNGTVTTKQIAQKKIESENTELQKEAVTNANEAAILKSFAELKYSFEQVEISLNQIELSEAILHEEMARHKEGVSSINEVLQAQNELLMTKQTYLSNLSNCFRADLELKRVTNNIIK